MSPLNDNELNSLLEQAKRKSPEPPPQLAARTLRAYEAKVARSISWRRYFLRRVSVPWPIGALAALLFVLIGALTDHSFRQPLTVGGGRASDAALTHPTAVLTFKEFQPVSEIKPRVIRSIRDDQ